MVVVVAKDFRPLKNWVYNESRFTEIVCVTEDRYSVKIIQIRCAVIVHSTLDLVGFDELQNRQNQHNQMTYLETLP